MLRYLLFITERKELKPLWPAFWCSVLNRYQHPICMQVQVPAAPLAFQIPSIAPEKAEDDGPDAWVPAIHVGYPDSVPGTRF